MIKCFDKDVEKQESLYFVVGIWIHTADLENMREVAEETETGAGKWMQMFPPEAGILLSVLISRLTSFDHEA